MFPFIQAFISLFMPRPTMDDPASLLLDPAGILSTRIFHCLYKSWAVLNPNPDEVLTGLEVICIMHNKHHDYPEHDFLVVETKDRQRKTRLFILERNVSNQQDEAFIEPAKRDEKIKEVATKAISGSDGSRLASIEEGSQSSISTTLSSPQSADLVSDSLDKPPTTPADDRFLGESYASKPKWQGKNIRYIKPTRLSLYELALLANAVHKLHSYIRRMNVITWISFIMLLNNILVYVQKMPTKIKAGWFTSMVLVYLTSMAVGEAP